MLAQPPRQKGGVVDIRAKSVSKAERFPVSTPRCRRHWRKETTKRLIELVRFNEVLCDASHMSHKAKDIQLEAVVLD